MEEGKLWSQMSDNVLNVVHQFRERSEDPQELRELEKEVLHFCSTAHTAELKRVCFEAYWGASLLCTRRVHDDKKPEDFRLKIDYPKAPQCRLGAALLTLRLQGDELFKAVAECAHRYRESEEKQLECALLTFQTLLDQPAPQRKPKHQKATQEVNKPVEPVNFEPYFLFAVIIMFIALAFGLLMLTIVRRISH